MKDKITVQTTVNAPIEKVWKFWTTPKHIMEWNSASEDWHTPKAKNDLRVDGRFNFRMEAKDKSEGFNLSGTYTNIQKHNQIEYDLEDDRHVKVKFNETPEGIQIIESFEPEQENSEKMQREGWQAILDNFKQHVESN